MEGHTWRASAQIFNSAVAASAISASWELGALDELNEFGVIDVDDFAARNHLDVSSTRAMFRALAAVGVVRREDGKVVAGPNFAEICRTRSFFHWLTRGSAELFRQMPVVLRQENRVGDFYHRDAAAIAFACHEITTFCYDPWFWSALRDSDLEFSHVADLGCGSGNRLIEILQRYPAASGVGVDIAADALTAARTAAGEAGLSDRLAFVEADMLTMDLRPAFADVDLLTCFMAGHDLWPRDHCISTLLRFREIFPNVRRFLIGDATRTSGIPDDDLPVFTLGFEVAHDMMGTDIPTVGEWESVFEPGGWRLRQKHSINMVVGEVIFELEPLPS